ncbi:MAG: DUF427 domain-containing protein [Gammaproteobacteria bacterium]|nr:DUF427 domain-containing protein [Gammaproteobacteria bacterium]
MSTQAGTHAPGFARHPEHAVRLEPCPRRIRAALGGHTIADSTGACYLFETGRAPVYYFPRADVRMDLLERSTQRTYCPFKGHASYWSVRAGDRVAEDAVWGYEDPYLEMVGLADRVACYWSQMDHWYEEDEEVFVHPRDPYVRVDALASSRRVRIELGGQTIADSSRAIFVFETGLPTRYYLPAQDVREDLLEPSATRTRCPYKGEAQYWSARVGAVTVADIAWRYARPLPEVARIAGLIALHTEKADVVQIAGEPLPPF